MYKIYSTADVDDHENVYQFDTMMDIVDHINENNEVIISANFIEQLFQWIVITQSSQDKTINLKFKYFTEQTEDVNPDPLIGQNPGGSYAN